MRPSDAKALFLMVIADATPERWEFAWGHDVEVEGIVYPHTRIACLTRPRIVGASPSSVLKTAVHEAAHCLDIDTRGKSDHGKVWKALETKLKRRWGVK